MPGLPTITPLMAHRHEQLWLRLVALQATIDKIAAKKPEAPVGAVERIAAESLLSECWPFLRHGVCRLPVAAPYLAGLAVQLSQALALMAGFENARSFWDGERKCRSWRVREGHLPIGRLHQEVAPSVAAENGTRYRDELVKRMLARERQRYQDGFRDGQAAGVAKAECSPRFPAETKTYPRPDGES